jgi:transposase
MRLKALELSKEERAKLETIVRSCRVWRIRERSRTILMFSDGVPAKEIAIRQELTLEAVYENRYRWPQKGMASLSDVPRSGTPSKLQSEQIEQLTVWASSEEALTSTALLARLEHRFEVPVHRNMLTGTLRRAGLVWKRTQQSLKKASHYVSLFAVLSAVDCVEDSHIRPISQKAGLGFGDPQALLKAGGP